MELEAEQKTQVANICDKVLAGQIEGAILIFARKERKDIGGRECVGLAIEGFSVGDPIAQLALIKAVGEQEEQVISRMGDQLSKELMMRMLADFLEREKSKGK